MDNQFILVKYYNLARYYIIRLVGIILCFLWVIHHDSDWGTYIVFYPYSTGITHGTIMGYGNFHTWGYPNSWMVFSGKSY
jgi:hypothetical protein